MRSIVGALVVIGCGSPAPVRPAAIVAPSVCDPGRWNTLASSTQRAWLASLDDPPRSHPSSPIGRSPPPYGLSPVTVLETEGDDVQIAMVTDGVIVTRWAPVIALGRAATTTALVSPRPDAAPDPAVRILVGYKLPATGGAWLAAKQSRSESEGLELEGFVPAAVRGVVWDGSSRPPIDPRRWHLDAVIRSGPSASAPILARVTHAASLELRGERDGFWDVIARTQHAEVRGFIEKPPPPPPPPPRPGRLGHDYDFSEDEIEGELVVPPSPLPPGTCLSESPGGPIVGMILGAQPASVKPARVSGWFQITLATPWGAVAYFTDTRPSEPAPPPVTWPFEDTMPPGW